MNGGYVMELRDLEYIVVVAEHGQLGRGAEPLRLSQPALSIARLEEAMEGQNVSPQRQRHGSDGGSLLAALACTRTPAVSSECGARLVSDADELVLSPRSRRQFHL